MNDNSPKSRLLSCIRRKVSGNAGVAAALHPPIYVAAININGLDTHPSRENDPRKCQNLLRAGSEVLRFNQPDALLIASDIQHFHLHTKLGFILQKLLRECFHVFGYIGPSQPGASLLIPFRRGHIQRGEAVLTMHVVDMQSRINPMLRPGTTNGFVPGNKCYVRKAVL